MTKLFYSRLAYTGFRKNHRMYVPYLLTCIVTIMMYYIIGTLTVDPEVIKSATLSETLGYAFKVTAIFSVILLFYTNCFLVRQRKKELGLYNVLGLGKRHIARLLAVESIYTAVTTLIAGIIAGLIFSRLLFLALGKIVHFDIGLSYRIEWGIIGNTAVLFAGIYALTLVSSLWQMRKVSPVEMLKGSETGEREPKTRKLLTLAGILTLGGGYFISLTVDTPLQAIALFFIAVVLVIIGTYLLFITGSIALLKGLRKNKSFYYRTKNFTAVSGMLYRMKRNAAGLATICILSTIVLVILSSTSSLYLGMNDILKQRFPKEFRVKQHKHGADNEEKLREIIMTEANHYDVDIKDLLFYRESVFRGVLEGNELKLITDEEYAAGFNDNHYVEVRIIPAEDYSKTQDREVSLKQGEVLYVSHTDKLEGDTLAINGKEYLAQNANEGKLTARSTSSVIPSLILVMHEDDIKLVQYGTENRENDMTVCEFDIKGNDNDIVEAENAMTARMEDEIAGSDISVESRMTSREEFFSLYGGLLFIGIFLGILFVMATVLIIYYKQITEGYEDQKRYKIMQKVGMSLKEVQVSVRQQILIVFFLPLVTAGIHMAVAFPVITKLLAALNLVNVPLFLKSTIGTGLLFIILYVIVFAITAREYYKIVK